jgi:hypothetical protein
MAIPDAFARNKNCIHNTGREKGQKFQFYPSSSHPCSNGLIVAQDKFAARRQVTGFFTAGHENCKDILQNHTFFVLSFENYHLE